MWRIRQTRTITQNCDSGTGSDFFQDFPVGATAGRVFSVRPARKGNERHLIAGLSQNCTEDFFDDEKGAVVRSGPNADGLTASAEKQIMNGPTDAGMQAAEIHLNRQNPVHCSACGNGWGTPECLMQPERRLAHRSMRA